MQNAFTRKYNMTMNVLFDVVEVSFLSKNKILEKAIWDTGASTSSINVKYAEEMGLIPVSYANISTANGPCVVPVYYINIKFNDNFSINGIAVTGTDLVDIDMLLGMDIINRGQFTISNNSEGTTISFLSPSDTTTDYVEEMNKKTSSILKKMGRNEMCPCGSGKKIKNCCGPKYGL